MTAPFSLLLQLWPLFRPRFQLLLGWDFSGSPVRLWLWFWAHTGPWFWLWVLLRIWIQLWPLLSCHLHSAPSWSFSHPWQLFLLPLSGQYLSASSVLVIGLALTVYHSLSWAPAPAPWPCPIISNLVSGFSSGPWLGCDFGSGPTRLWLQIWPLFRQWVEIRSHLGPPSCLQPHLWQQLQLQDPSWVTTLILVPSWLTSLSPAWHRALTPAPAQAPMSALPRLVLDSALSFSVYDFGSGLTWGNNFGSDPCLGCDWRQIELLTSALPRYWSETLSPPIYGSNLSSASLWLTLGCYCSSGSTLGQDFCISPIFGCNFGSGHCPGGCFGSTQALGLKPPQEAAVTWPLFGPWLWLWPHLGLWFWLHCHLGLLLCLWSQFWFWIVIGLWLNLWPDIGQMLCQQLDGRSQLWLWPIGRLLQLLFGLLLQLQSRVKLWPRLWPPEHLCLCFDTWLQRCLWSLRRSWLLLYPISGCNFYFLGSDFSPVLCSMTGGYFWAMSTVRTWVWLSFWIRASTVVPAPAPVRIMASCPVPYWAVTLALATVYFYQVAIAASVPVCLWLWLGLDSRLWLWL